MGIKKYFGTKDFYKMVMAIAVPIMIQNGISQFVSVLDNLMVGRLGTEQMSGVAIANQLIFIYYLAIFGGLSGAGIFGAQFAGKGDDEGIRNVFRIKLFIAAAVFTVGFVVFRFFNEPLIKLFLHESGDGGNLELTLQYGQQYMGIMLWGLAPFAISQMYATSLRELGKTKPPMLASLIAVCTDLVFNYILIFGKFGAPAMGARGAALATVISRFVELAVIAGWAHTHTHKVTFFKGVYKTLRVPAGLGADIVKQGIPLLLNEMLWSMGMTMMTQCYSMRGLTVVAATNICYTIANLFNVVFLALGSAIGIIVGNLLGAGKLEEAADTDRKMIAFSVASCLLVGGLLAASSGIIPQFYNTTDEVRYLAKLMIIISACYMPFDAFINACYFTLRSGGKTKITMIFDSGYTWAVLIPLTAALAYFTDMPIITLFIVSYLPQIPKCLAGYYLVKSGKWIRNLVVD